MADPDASGDQIGLAKGLVAFQLFWSNGNEIPRLTPRNDRCRSKLWEPSVTALNRQQLLRDLFRQFGLEGVQEEASLGVMAHQRR